jgi:hypothetical protein
MSLKKSNTIIIISCALISLILLTIVFFPRVVDNIMTGLASIATFSASVLVNPNPNEVNTTPPAPEPKKNITITFFSVKKKSEGTAIKTSFAEADYISINTTAPGVFEDYLALYNPENVTKEFTINFTTNFIRSIVSNITLEPNESAKIPISIDTTALGAGGYTDYVFIRSGDREEMVTITLKVLGEGKEEAESKLPEQEQPATVTEKVGEQVKEKRPVLLSIILMLLCALVVLGMILFLHLKKGAKAIKNQANKDISNANNAETNKDDNPQ